MAILENIRVDSLRARSRQLAFSEPVAAFDALQELVDSGEVVLVDPVAGSLVAQLAGDMIEVDGLVSLRVEQPCSRCLAPVSSDLDVTISLLYAQQNEGDLYGEEEERELDSAELGLIPYAGDVINLRPELEQEIIMAMPQRPLCKDDCCGLCPVCGGDLNLTKCDCQPPIFHGGLAALKKLKI